MSTFTPNKLSTRDYIDALKQAHVLIVSRPLWFAVSFAGIALAALAVFADWRLSVVLAAVAVAACFGNSVLAWCADEGVRHPVRRIIRAFRRAPILSLLTAAIGPALILAGIFLSPTLLPTQSASVEENLSLLGNPSVVICLAVFIPILFMTVIDAIMTFLLRQWVDAHVATDLQVQIHDMNPMYGRIEMLLVGAALLAASTLMRFGGAGVVALYFLMLFPAWHYVVFRMMFLGSRRKASAPAKAQRASGPLDAAPDPGITRRSPELDGHESPSLAIPVRGLVFR